MLTDSRSFMSYPRHEYFRRVLCNLFGKDIEARRDPGRRFWPERMVGNICFGNAQSYFRLPGLEGVEVDSRVAPGSRRRWALIAAKTGWKAGGGQLTSRAGPEKIVEDCSQSAPSFAGVAGL